VPSSLSDKLEEAVLDWSPDLVCSFGVGGNVHVDLARDLQRWAIYYGRRARHARGMAAHRCAARCRHWNSNGVHRIWIRRLIIIYAPILSALNLIHHAIMWRAMVNGMVFGCVSAWYFYFKPNVTAYFRELKKV
jgi:hypothetical protein